jgi:4-aminobutyrate aminotransferase/(S)-3-amino-2-methylpropionate transaminase
MSTTHSSTASSTHSRNRLVTAIPGPRSQALAARQQLAVSSAISTMMPVFAQTAGDGWVKDVDGNTLIDLGAGIAVTNVGSAAPRVVNAVSEQVAAFTHTCFMITPYDGYVAVAEALNELTPGDHQKRSALFNSGAEAVENAIKIARSFTQRSAVVAFDHAYHGRTNLTMALTAKSSPYKSGFGPFASEIYRAPMSYPYHDHLSGTEAAARAISMIEKQVGAGQLAAMIIEPIQGEGGFIVPAPGFLPSLARWAKTNNVVFIADEIQTGFARTGQMFASDHEGIVPDLVVTAKGIAGGLPLAAVTGRRDMMNAPHAGGLGGTYGGNPVACAAALAALQTYASDALTERARHIGEIIQARFRDAQQQDSRIGDVRGRGAMMAIELVKRGGDEPDPELVARVTKACHLRGVIVLTCGTYGNVIRFLPPLTIPDDLLEEGLSIVLDELENA